MLREMLCAKIHMATVTGSNLSYMGSLTVPGEILKAVGIIDGEKVAVANVNTGARFETYVQTGTKKREFVLNGAAARLGEPGDRIIIFAYELMTEDEARESAPRIVLMGEANRSFRLLRKKGPGRGGREGRGKRGGRG